MKAPTVSLDCPGCGSEVFIRDIATWYTDEEEYCAGCGSRVMVALDEDDADPDLLTARVYIFEHSGEVVARLRAEGELGSPSPLPEGVGMKTHELEDEADSRALINKAEQACADGLAGCVGAGCVPGCVPGHVAKELLDAYDEATKRADSIWSTSTERLTPGMVAEHHRLDGMWQQLVAEKDAARRLLQDGHDFSIASGLKVAMERDSMRKRAEKAETDLAARRLKHLTDLADRAEAQAKAHRLDPAFMNAARLQDLGRFSRNEFHDARWIVDVLAQESDVRDLFAELLGDRDAWERRVGEIADELIETDKALGRAGDQLREANERELGEDWAEATEDGS